MPYEFLEHMAVADIACKAWGHNLEATFVAAALARALATHGVEVAILESNVLRRVFTPHPRYDEEEREVFYGAMAYVGWLLTEHGVPVIFDATAHRRAYRARARAQIPRFLEVYMDCPLAICMARDPKGIYRKAQAGGATTVPGLQAAYEPPEDPEVVVQGQETPEVAAQRVVARLIEQAYLRG